MDTDLFQTLIDVARSGSFALAARSRNTDPSSVSRQIATLETHLGYRLFERSTRRLTITEAGQLTLDRIKAPLDELTDVGSFVRDAVAAPQGRLSLTTSIGFAERCLIPALPDFVDKYPAIELDLNLSDHNLDLGSAQIDVAIRLGAEHCGIRKPGSGPDKGYVSTRLFSTHYHVVASPSYLKSATKCRHPRDLARQRCIVFRLPNYQSVWRYRRAGNPAEEVAISGSMVVSNALAIRCAALAGLGIALLADWAIQADLESGELVKLFPSFEFCAERFDTAVWALHRERGYVPAKTAVFIDHLKRS